LKAKDGISDPALHLTTSPPTVLLPNLPPVDTAAPAAHCPGVSKKPRKVDEAATPYAAKKPVKVAAASPKSTVPGGQTVDAAAFKKVADKIFSERKELLHKLAQ
jgi:hypothetical protein